MDLPHLFHLIVLALWGGVVLAEVVIELAALREPALREATARFHYLIDAMVELPLLALVLLSGALLLRGASLDASLLAKVGAGVGAVGANLYCVATVVRRDRQRRDASRLAELGRRVVLSAVVGVPLALLALALGAHRVGWLLSAHRW